MSKPHQPGAATPRRDFLRTLALAPAAAAVAAGCATSSGAARSSEDASGGPDPRAGAADDQGDAALRAIRALPLAADAEPAFVFRAAPARPGA